MPTHCWHIWEIACGGTVSRRHSKCYETRAAADKARWRAGYEADASVRQCQPEICPCDHAKEVNDGAVPPPESA